MTSRRYAAPERPPLSTATTRGIRVDVTPEYIPGHSDPKNSRWVFAYDVTIQNEGPERVQLISRHWTITDATGRVEEVRGAGVVGEQPVLAPGERFSYRSGCPLPTPMGTMHGTYQMVTARGERFEAEIAPFTLVEPYALN